MAMKPTMIHLPAELIAQLDRRAIHDEVSRSQVVRDAIVAYIEVDSAAELDDRVRRAYATHPLDTPDAWGDMESFLTAVRSEKSKHR